MIGGAGGWSVYTSIQSAVIAPGKVVVRSFKKRLQHLDGGIISSIHVQDGDKVAKRDVLLRLDETQSLAALAVLRNRALGLRIRRARLRAEQKGSKKLVFSKSLLQQVAGNEDRKAILLVQQSLFATGLEIRLGRKEQMMERVAQQKQEVNGLNALKKARIVELRLLRAELKDLQGLKTKNLVVRPRLNALRRNIAEKSGQHGRVVADIARSGGRIAEEKLKMIELDESFRKGTRRYTICKRWRPSWRNFAKSSRPPMTVCADWLLELPRLARCTSCPCIQSAVLYAPANPYYSSCPTLMNW